MQRRLYLGELQTPAASPGCTILTPNENAARTLGILPLSLEGLAQLTLGEGRVANPILAQRLLREAVENVLDSTDPAGSPGPCSPPFVSSSVRTRIWRRSLA